MSFKLEVFGDYALFTRPEMKAERVSYDVMTPSAARGILEAIFWHPGMLCDEPDLLFQHPAQRGVRQDQRAAGKIRNAQRRRRAVPLHKRLHCPTGFDGAAPCALCD